MRRFSTHDGAGIRTTVFFKGCPLRCKWCHNPEGISTQRRPLFFPKRCIGCKLCEQTARAAGEDMLAAGGILATDCVVTDDDMAATDSVVATKQTQRPDGLRVRGILFRADDAASVELWERLIMQCPGDALKWDSRTVTSAALADELLRDLPFFRHGGGVTLSGGEPLLQANFAADVLARMQAAGVHTAIETALLVPETSLRHVLPHLDHVFADCKMLDRAAHIQATSVPNDRILENLRILLRGARTASVRTGTPIPSGGGMTTSGTRVPSDGAPFPTVTIRTPMIPKFTATDANVAAIAKFLASENPDVHYELLNYNPLAAAKYPLVGRAYCFDENPQKFSAEEMQHFADVARREGLRNVTLDE